AQLWYIFSFVFYSCRAHRVLHSFPTRRSSDLWDMRHTISVLVENKFGVLTRVAGLFSGRGYNIDTLNVAPTDDPTASRMTIVTRDRKSTRLNSSHVSSSYAVFCLKKKTQLTINLVPVSGRCAGLANTLFGGHHR